MSFGLPELAEAIRRFCKDNLPGRTPLRVRIYTLEDQEPLQLPVVAANGQTAERAPFVPTDFQGAILEALEGKGMRTGALARELHCASAQLFKKPRGGIAELIEEGLVKHHDRVGYYRPDAPPPRLADQIEEG